MAWILTGVVACLAAYAFAVKPAMERIQTLNRVIPEKQRQLQQLRIKCAQYTSLTQQLEAIRDNVAAARQKDFSFPAFIESLVEQHHLREKLVKITRQDAPHDADHLATAVQVRLKGMTLQELVNLLAALKAAPVPAGIKTIHITTSPADVGLLDSTVEITHLKSIGTETTGA